MAGCCCFPNPAKDKITVHGLKGKADYNIYNGTGTILLQGFLNDKNEVISLSALPYGLYLLKLFNERGVINVVKLVIKNEDYMKLLAKKLSLFIAQHKLFEFIEDCCQPITKYLFYVNKGDVLF